MNYIALKMLMGDRGKYLGIVMGLTFASLIMTQQPAIFVGLMMRSYSFITDVGLPGLNGRQVAEAASAERPDMKILFVTARTGLYAVPMEARGHVFAAKQ